MISARKLNKSYGTTSVLKNVSFTIKEGEIATLFGPNGCGKSTTLRIISGLEVPDSGVLSFPSKIRSKTAVVSQNYRESLLPWQNARENILFPLKLKGITRRERQQRLEKLLLKAPIYFDLEKQIFELSGGQAQFVALLRALLSEPKVLLLDEPTSALDHFMREELLQYLLSLRSFLGLTIVSILHDLNDAIAFSDSLLLFQKDLEFSQISLGSSSTHKEVEEIYFLAGLKRQNQENAIVNR